MSDDLITAEHIKAADTCETLGPTYFAARSVAERFMGQFQNEHFKPLIDDFTKKFCDELWLKAECFFLSDTETNIQLSVWRMVDEIVREILGGHTPWIAQRYALGARYECDKVRAALARLIPKELQDARILDLETQVAELTESLDRERRFR